MQPTKTFTYTTSDNKSRKDPFTINFCKICEAGMGEILYPCDYPARYFNEKKELVEELVPVYYTFKSPFKEKSNGICDDCKNNKTRYIDNDGILALIGGLIKVIREDMIDKRAFIRAENRRYISKYFERWLTKAAIHPVEQKKIKRRLLAEAAAHEKVFRNKPKADNSPTKATITRRFNKLGKKKWVKKLHKKLEQT